MKLMKKMTKVIAFLMVCLLGISNANIVNAEYDGEAAAEYAEQYWDSYNSSYPNYIDKERDCTNFASQCVLAGGIKKKSLPKSKIKLMDFGSTHSCTDYWSCDYYKYKIAGITIRKGYIPTTTWNLVDNDTSKTLADSIIYGFQDFMKEKMNKTVTTYSCNSSSEMEELIKDAKVGDIVQIRKKGDTRFSHTYIVGKKKRNSKKKKDIYFYSHTDPRGAKETDSLQTLIENKTISSEWTLALISM